MALKYRVCSRSTIPRLLLQVRDTPFDFAGNPTLAEAFAKLTPPAMGFDNNLVLFGLGDCARAKVQ